MTPAYQILLFTVIIILTALMVIIGWQVYQILSEIRKMLVKSNQVMTSFASVGSSLTQSVQSLSGFTSGLKAIIRFLNHFKKKTENE